MASPNTPVSAILQRIVAAGKAYDDNNPGSREMLMDLSHQLIAGLERPSEFIQRSFWAEPTKAALCRLAVDLGIFDHLKISGEGGISAEDMAFKTGAEHALIARILRHLAATHVVSSRNGRYYATPLSSELQDERFQHSITYIYDVAGAPIRKFPEYFKSIEYKNPTSIVDGPFQFAHGTKLPFFAWVDANPPYLSYFNTFMTVCRAGKASWCDEGFYPIADRLVSGFDSSYSDVILVDVGGGLGHDLIELTAKHSQLPGKLVLQDRVEVISSIKPDRTAVFTAQAHDFFTPQPVQHARAYYIHGVLHDWSDDDCIRILKNLKPSLRKGYSRLLLNEVVVAENAPTSVATSLDQLMLALVATRERTENDWKALIERSGMRVLKIYEYPGVAESLIEAELI